MLVWLSFFCLGIFIFICQLSLAAGGYIEYPKFRTQWKFPKMPRMPNGFDFGSDTVASDVVDIIENAPPPDIPPPNPPPGDKDLNIREIILRKLRDNPSALLSELLTDEEFYELIMMLLEIAG
jgi:hypothetical protein